MFQRRVYLLGVTADIIQISLDVVIAAVALGRDLQRGDGA